MTSIMFFSEEREQNEAVTVMFQSFHSHSVQEHNLGMISTGPSTYEGDRKLCQIYPLKVDFVQRSAKRLVRGCEKFLPALA